jgi:hypothetical protein
MACFAARANYFNITDNVHILCLSCNVKQSKTTTKLSEKSRIKLRSRPAMSALILLPFLPDALHEAVPEKLY